MGYSMLESANSFMGRSIYEQEEMEAKAKMAEGDDELEVSIAPEEEGGDDLEGLEDLDAEGGEGEEELTDEEAAEEMPVELAIRAMQLILNGEAESAEEALDIVQSVDDGEVEIDDIGGEPEEEAGDELAPDEEDTIEVEEESTGDCNCPQGVGECDETDDTPEISEGDDEDTHEDDTEEIVEGDDEPKEEIEEEQDIDGSTDEVVEETTEEEEKEVVEEEEETYSESHMYAVNASQRYL